MADTSDYPFQLKKVYSFTLYPTVILPGDYTNVTVMGIIDYETALQLADIPAIHTNVYPYLPTGTPDDPSQYDYLKVKLSSGVITVLGLPWINLNTVELVESLRATIVVEDVTNNDATRLRECLVQNGFNNITISIS